MADNKARIEESERRIPAKGSKGAAKKGGAVGRAKAPPKVTKAKARTKAKDQPRRRETSDA